MKLLLAKPIKKYLVCLLALFTLLQIGVSNSNTYAIEVGSSSTGESITLQPIGNNGENTVYGSILNTRFNEVNLPLTTKQLLFIFRKVETNKTPITLTLTSALDSTKVYSIPINAISIQRKKINGRTKRYLVINISNLKSTSDAAITPRDFPSNSYKLSIQSNNINIVTDIFNYQAPIVISGNVNGQNQGLVSIEDIDGEIISNGTASISKSGSFLIEVLGDKIPEVLTENNSLILGNTSSNNNEDISIGFIHVIGVNDLYAIVPLNTNISNLQRSAKPEVINDLSTLISNIGGNYIPLAIAIAKQRLQELTKDPTDETDTKPSSSCEIDFSQIVNRCKFVNNDSFESIGSDFKKFVLSNNCTDPTFTTLKDKLQVTEGSGDKDIGTGYCEYAKSIALGKNNRACEIYSSILSDFKSGEINKLPCPPDFCDRFSGIRPPRCVKALEYCANEEEGISISASVSSSECRGQNCKSTCISRPPKDLFCARIGKDVTDKECIQGGGTKDNATWAIAASSKGNIFCVPQSLQSINSAGLSLEKIADSCELNSCHKTCEEIFTSKANVTPTIVKRSLRNFLDVDLQEQETIMIGEASSSGGNTVTVGGENTPSPRCDVCDCHFSCDAEVGRVIDCSNPLTKYFSIKCCDSKTPITGSPNSPRPLDIKGCLCGNFGNFNENGIIKEEAQTVCQTTCPQGFEKDPIGDRCLPICKEGFLRDPNGSCKKNCPKGLIEDEATNSCICSQGLALGKNGVCVLPESIPKCAPRQISTPLNPCTCVSSGTLNSRGICDCPFGFSYTELGCSKQKICEENENPIIKDCQCASGALASEPGASSFKFPNPRRAICQCPKGQKYTVDGCIQIPPHTCAQYESPSQTNCTCAKGGIISSSEIQQTIKLYDDPTTQSINDLCLCSPNELYTESGCIPAPQICGQFGFNRPTLNNPCSCAIGAILGSDSICQCPSGQRYTVNGCVTPAVQKICDVNEIPLLTNCKCASGTLNIPPTTGGFFPPSPTGIFLSPPTDFFPPSPSLSSSPCQCPPGQAYTTTGCKATNRICSLGEISSSFNPCICVNGATQTGPGGTCQCPSGQTYSTTGCKTTVTTICTPEQISTSSNPCICAIGANNFPDAITAVFPPSDIRTVCKCSTGQTYTTDGCKITTPTTCAPGQVSTATNPCTCASLATTGFGGACTCPPGQTYTTLGCTNTTTPVKTCGVNEASTSTNPCTCATGATVSSTGICQCFNAIYTTNGCISVCDIGQVSTASSPCTCQTPATPTGSSGICTCPSGQTYSVLGCIKICTPGEISTLPNNLCTCAKPATVQTPGTPCQCPTVGQTYSINGCTSASTSSSLTITSSQLFPATTNIQYSVQLQVSGGTAPYTWSTTSPLPLGFSLSPGGILSGFFSPDQANITYPISVKVTDSLQQTATKSLSLFAQLPLSITSTQLPNGTANIPYSTQLQAKGGVSPYTWSNASPLPSGLMLSPDGTLAGTLPQGDYFFYVNAKDSNNLTTSTGISLSTQLGTLPALTITSGTLPIAMINAPYSVQLEATGGQPPYTWSNASPLPAGLSISPSGTLSGTLSTVAGYSFSVRITDSLQQSITKYLSLNSQ